MALNLVVVTLLGLLGVVALVTAVLAAGHRLGFRIAMRNVRRGRARTALLIAGLLVGTTIVSGSLVVGDSVQQLSVHYTYLGAGYVDEAIYGTAPTGGFSFFPYATYPTVRGLLSDDPAIAGVSPEIVASGAAFDRVSGVPETNLNLIGLNGNETTALGSFVAENGTALAGPSPGHVLIDEETATALNASVGDPLAVFGVNSTVLVVEAIVQENLRGAFITGGLSPGNLFVPLASAEQLENAPNQINYLVVTNSGSQSAGAAASTAVSASLNTTLASVLSSHDLTVHTPLETALQQAGQSSQSLLTVFLVLGLFSIVAGAMLIVGIFVMLAEERKGEMGVLRAIGMRRRELVYAYYFEGVTYAAGSALAGTVLGVAVGFVLVYLAGFILSGEGIPESAILQSFSVTTQSLVTAYVVGFLLTLVTVTVACRRASRLNIVRAIRDIPEPPPPLRTYTLLAYLGVAALAVGVLGFLRTAHGASDLSYPLIFVSLLPLGAGMIAARFVANRLAFSAVGAAILAWTGIEPLHTALLGSAHTGGIFIVFVEGILMVFGALLLFLFNAPSLAAGVRRLLGRRSESSPVVRIGLDYPTRQPTRTVVTLAIFALVVFTMVATAAFGATIQGNLDQTVANESGGYSYFGISQAPIPNLWGAIQNNSSLRPLFVAAVSVVTGSVDVSVPGFGSNPYRDRIYSPPTAATGPTSFYATNAFPFQSTWHGLSTAAAFHALATNASVAIVDSTYAPPTAGFTGGGPSNHPTLTVGTAIGLTTPGGGPSMNVTVIGILKESIVGGVWVNPATASALGYANASAYLLSVAGGISTTHAAQLAKRAFFSAGLILFDLRALLATSINTTEGFIGLLEIFVGLGLAVGIAAMGILALRAVVERRREIGMLRASGFTRAMILRAFVLEYSFVTLLGVAMGVALGLLIVYEVSIGPYAADAGIARFVVPWTTVGEIAIVAYLLVLAAIAVPSLRAARLPPAEAVRATE